jgi:hypothetical protein
MIDEVVEIEHEHVLLPVLVECSLVDEYFGERKRE